jgi:hypothetical protein
MSSTHGHAGDMPGLGQTLAATCPGCGLPILFDPAELRGQQDDPAARDVMCASCGTITPRRRLALKVDIGSALVSRR